jgi:hypothetical protein
MNSPCMSLELNHAYPAASVSVSQRACGMQWYSPLVFDVKHCCEQLRKLSQHVPTKTFTSTSTWQLLTSQPFALRHLKDMVEVLLAAKASVDLPCSDGATALILASQVCRLNGLDGLASGFWRLEFHRSVRWI